MPTNAERLRRGDIFRRIVDKQAFFRRKRKARQEDLIQPRVGLYQMLSRDESARLVPDAYNGPIREVGEFDV